MKILICGSRSANDGYGVFLYLDNWLAASQYNPNHLTIIAGGAPGVDSFAEAWAVTRGIRTEIYPANWTKYGRAAGPIRNQEMLDRGSPDGAIVFDGGTGTADMRRRLQRNGITILDAHISVERDLYVHPQMNDEVFQNIEIKEPTYVPLKNYTAWGQPNEVASFTPRGIYPRDMYPSEFVETSVPAHLKTYEIDSAITSAGVLIVEPDRRVWVVSPTNKFTYINTFPKGRLNYDKESLLKCAARETFEETGLNVEIQDHLVDQRRGKFTKVRWFVGKRVSGCPSLMGWESQALHLVPINQLKDFVEKETDKEISQILVDKLS